MDKKKSEFDFEKLIHDTNNILCQISSRISLLEYDENYGQEVNELAEESCEATDFMAKYIKRTVLMNYAIDKEVEIVNIEDLITEIHDEIHEKNKKINFELKFENEIPEFKINELDLRTLLEELICNACEAYEDSSGKVLINVFFDKTIIILIQNDKGFIKPEILNNYNKEFYTSKDRTYHKGIGLPLIKNLLKRTGISIKFESKNNKTSVELLIDSNN